MNFYWPTRRPTLAPQALPASQSVGQLLCSPVGLTRQPAGSMAVQQAYRSLAAIQQFGKLASRAWQPLISSVNLWFYLSILLVHICTGHFSWNNWLHHNKCCLCAKTQRSIDDDDSLAGERYRVGEGAMIRCGSHYLDL